MTRSKPHIDEPAEPERHYNQLCVWPGTLLEDHTPDEFEEWVSEAFEGTRIRFAEVVRTLPDQDENGCAVADTGGRSDLFFWVHDDDIEKFAVPRLAAGIRWWEDVLLNGGAPIYPHGVVDRYPFGWSEDGTDETHTLVDKVIEDEERNHDDIG